VTLLTARTIDARTLAERFRAVRDRTEVLARPLSPEDQTLQSMPDASPTKWHRAHTSWFFETFVLEPQLCGYRSFDPGYRYLFNSYYDAVGERHQRSERGLVSRPGAADVSLYRAHVDVAMGELLHDRLSPGVEALVELGLHHEQQHQELLLMDIKHAFWKNPSHPAYLRVLPSAPTVATDAPSASWVTRRGGRVEIGATPGEGFAFDNEGPRHAVLLRPFAVADRLVTNREWLGFVLDGGYERSDLWLSEGWARVQAERWRAPLYWSEEAGHWRTFTLGGDQPLALDDPVSHVSLFEADAYARWAGHRRPTEAEWEAVASCEESSCTDLFNGVWQWTSSSYSPYPRFRPSAGAVGEYNGKFMINQYVLRGGSWATPTDHTRVSYRNFFPAGARWAFSGLRLATDA
jgi:ergothioneine biosynthesis protein EgtB